ncbi:MAG: hypothetical protein ACRBBW_20850 [Cellvibrionaceae bacterium]
MSAKFFNDGFCEEDVCFTKFQPFKLNRVFHKGPDEVEETEQEKTLAKVANEKWERGEEIYRPMQQKFMSDVDAIDTEASNNYASGVATQQTKTAFSDVRDQVAKQDIKTGINPNSGRFKSGQSEMATKEAEATGENVGRSQVATTEDSAIGMMNVVALGQGQSTKAQLGFTGLADSAAAKSRNDAINAANESAAKREAVGTIAGGVASYGSNNGWFKSSGGISDSSMVAGRQGDSGYGYSGLEPGQAYA